MSSTRLREALLDCEWAELDCDKLRDHFGALRYDHDSCVATLVRGSFQAA